MTASSYIPTEVVGSNISIYVTTLSCAMSIIFLKAHNFESMHSSTFGYTETHFASSFGTL